VRHFAFGGLHRFQHQGHVAGLFTDLDHVARLHLVARDIDPLAVDQHMAVVDELTGGEGGRHELGAVDDRVQATLQETDEVLAGGALHARSLVIDAAELLLGDVAVIALQLLLGTELNAIVGELALATLAMLAGAVFTLVDRALGPAPDVFAKPAIDLVLATAGLAHVPGDPLSWLSFYSAPRARPVPKEKPARPGSSPVRNPSTRAAGGPMSNRKHVEKPSFPPLSGRPAIEGEAFDN